MMYRYLKFVGKLSQGVKPISSIRPRESEILARLYSNKKDPTDLKKPLGTTKSVSECLPNDSKGPDSASSKNESNKGRTITPTECKQTAKKVDVPIYDKECKRPHVDPCIPQPSRLTPPGGPPLPPKMEVCGKRSMMDDMPHPGSSEEEKKQKNWNWILLVGALIAAGSLYQLWSMNYFGKDEQSKATKGSEDKKKSEKKKKKDRWPVFPPKVPSSSKDIPDSVPYLLIGAGTASFAAFRAIKSSDPKAQILVIGNEPVNPYMRPPLSKEMWYSEDRSKAEKLYFKQWNGTERSLFYEPAEFYTNCTDLMTQKNGGVAVAKGWNVVKLNLKQKVAYLEDGKEIHYDKCLIATGAIPKNLPIFEEASQEIKDKVSVFRDLNSFEKLEDIINDGAKSIAIIGGGYLGSELACALARRGKNQDLKVYQIFKEKGNMAKVLPEYLSKWTTEKVKAEGVEIVSSAEVENVKLVNKQLSLGLTNNKNIKVDHVIVAVGVEPNTLLAESAGLEVDPNQGGYLVNAELEARSDVYAAGDCACFYDVILGRRRVEHHDHAVVSGRLAGENMTGASKPFLHQSMLWSDLGPEVGYEAIGIVDSSLNTVAVYAKKAQEEKKIDDKSDEKKSGTEEEDYNKGVIFYLRDGIIVGIVLWNVFSRMHIARQILKENKKYEDLNEVAKLFTIHEE